MRDVRQALPALTSIAAAHPVLERKFRFQGKRFPIQFGIGIDKVVQRLALLRRVQPDVSPNAKLQAIVVMRAEEVILLLWMLSSL